MNIERIIGKMCDIEADTNSTPFRNDIFKCIFSKKNALISLKLPLKVIPNVRIDNIAALVQIITERRPSDKALSESMVVSLLTHICGTRLQWVKWIWLHFWTLLRFYNVAKTTKLQPHIFSMDSLMSILFEHFIYIIYHPIIFLYKIFFFFSDELLKSENYVQCA